MVRRGSIVHATLVRSASSMTNRRKDGTLVDPDADWTRRKKGEPTLDYKLDAAVNEYTGIVRKITLTSASRYERTVQTK